jgi:hypothetical protein
MLRQRHQISSLPSTRQQAADPAPFVPGAIPWPLSEDV